MTASAASPPNERPAHLGLALLLGLMVAWKAYSLSSGNFRIQETWSAWNYAAAFPQDLLAFALLYVAHARFLSRRGALGFALTVGLALAMLALQCIDARMKVRFLHPLSWQWIRYAAAEARTIGPDYAVFTGQSYWQLALASLSALALAFAVPWIPLLRALARPAAFVERGLRSDRLATWALIPLTLAAVFLPAQPYGLHRNFVVATLLPLDRAVPGYDDHAGRPTDAPIQRSRPESFAHLADPRLASCRGRNVVLYVIESLAREQTSLGSRGVDTTPTLARLLREGGVETRCFAQFANSAKATFGLLSGVFAAQTMEVLECEMAAMSGLPRALANAGYSTLCLTPQHLYYQGQRTMFQKLGFQELFAFLDFQALAKSRGLAFDEFGPPSRDDRMVFQWDHARLGERRPFFATYYTMSSHYSYQFPGQTKGSDEERHTRAVRYTDQVFGELLARYAELGILEDTLFVITADHGEDFLNGRFAVRHSSLAQDAHEVPLIFYAPGVDLSGLSLDVARQVDVMPTVLDLLGLSPEGLPMSGHSLLLQGRERPLILESYGTERTAALIEDGVKWMWDEASDARWRVDLRSDPHARQPRRIDAAVDPGDFDRSQLAVERLRNFAIYNEAFLRDVVAGRVEIAP